MPGQSVSAEAPIWPWLFGKMPAHGDFISRGLDDETIEQGDTTLAEAMALASNRWDAEWDDVYVETPVWRFIATPGVLGRFWITGVFLPSVDAVGRQYPLMAGLASQSLALLADTDATERALEAVEATARAALLDVLSVDAAMEGLTQTASALLLGEKVADRPVRLFATQMLTGLEAATWSPEARWWIAGAGAEGRLDQTGALSADALVALFRRLPAEPPSTEAPPVEPTTAIPAADEAPTPDDAVAPVPIEGQDSILPPDAPATGASGDQMGEDKP